MEIGLYEGGNGKFYVNWGRDGRVPYLKNKRSFRTRKQAEEFIKTLRRRYRKEKINFEEI